MQRNKDKIIIVFGNCVIAVSIYLHYLKYSNIQSSRWLGMLDGDIFYQAERLWMYFDQTYEPFYARIVDYGPELYYYSFIHYFYNFSDPVLASFWIITIFHMIAYGLAFNVIMLGFKTIPAPVKLSVIILCLSIPFAHMHYAFIKPDSNIVFLFVVLALFSLDKFIHEGSEKAIVATFLFLGAAAAIKWWGVFLLPGCIYILIKKRYKIGKFFFFLNTLTHLLAGIYLIAIVFNLLRILAYYQNELESKAPWVYELISTFNFWFIISAGLLLVLISYLTFRKLVLSEIIYPFKIILFSVISFSCFYAIINLPFGTSEAYLKTIYTFTSKLNFAPHALSNEIRFTDYLLRGFHTGFYTVTTLLMWILIIYAFLAKKLSELDIVFMLFVCSMLGFLYLFVTKVSPNQEALLIPFILLVGFRSLYNLLKKMRFVNIILFFIIIFEITFQNSLIASWVNLPSVVKLTQSYDDFPQEVITFQKKVEQLANGHDVYVCSFWIPLEKNKIILKKEECLNKSLDENLMKKGDVIVFNYHEDQSNLAPSDRDATKWIERSEKYSLSHSHFINVPHRYGHFEKKSTRIFKKI
jgi:hypothetical protein